ncbi:MAG: hypothetical protein EHM45_02805 [Desulfobacteraceae bacterium]|nr:MAG: hypothetical protein EHM45_02805 [Desulfobacteraceae bacterium]
MERNPFLGIWRITEMEQWDPDFINVEEQGYFKFGKGDQGIFQFGYVHGDMDYEIETVEGKPRLEFSFIGNDETDEINGRGWARIEDDGKMFGKLAFHWGERSWFRAKKKVKRIRRKK